MANSVLRDLARMSVSVIARRSARKLGVNPFIAGVAAEAAKSLLRIILQKTK